MRILIAFLITFVFLSLSFSTVIGDLASNMQPGTFAELKSNGYSQEFLNTYGDNCCNFSIFQYGAKAQWDPISEQFLFLGSPHDNPYKMIIYSSASNSWRTGPLPKSCMNSGHTSGGCAVHSYFYSGINTQKGKFYFLDPACCNNQQNVLAYDIASNKWSELSGSISAYHASYGGLAYFPERNGFLAVSGQVTRGVWWYNISSKNWTKLQISRPLGSYSQVVMYNPVHKVILFSGGLSSRDMFKMDATGKITVLAQAPDVVATPGSSYGSVFTLDPVSGKHLIFFTSRAFYEYDVPTDKWTKLNTTVPIFTTHKNPIFDIVATPVSTYGVTMIATSKPAKVWLYKHKESGIGIKDEVGIKPATPKLEVYPNPFNHAIAIILKNQPLYLPAHRRAYKSEFKIFDLPGRLLKTFSSSSNDLQSPPILSFEWDAKELPSGIYLLKGRIGNKRFSKKLLLQR